MILSVNKNVAIFLLLFASACAGPKIATEKQMEEATLKRAAYDLSCPEKDIKITNLQSSANTDLLFVGSYTEEILFGTEGCDKKSTYQARNDLKNKKVMVYKEGAAPEPVIINQATPVQSYTPPPSTPYQPPVYRPLGSLK